MSAMVVSGEGQLSGGGNVLQCCSIRLAVSERWSSVHWVQFFYSTDKSFRLHRQGRPDHDIIFAVHRIIGKVFGYLRLNQPSNFVLQ